MMTTSSTLMTITKIQRSQNKPQRTTGREQHHHEEQHHHDLLDVATEDAHNVAVDQHLHPEISRRNNSNDGTSNRRGRTLPATPATTSPTTSVVKSGAC